MNRVGIAGALPTFRLVEYGTDDTTARPDADVVYWVGTTGADPPQNAEAHDLVFIAS